MKWGVAILLAVTLIALLPVMIAVARKSARGKGGLGGVALVFGLAFGAMFDPAKGAAIENIQKKKNIGDAETGAAAEKRD